MKQILILMLVVIFALSCDVKDEELTMVRTPYVGNKIRLDGVYIGLLPGDNVDYWRYIFFYSNGVLLDFISKAKFDYLNQSPVLESVYNNKIFWAVFQVSNENIIIQGWKYSDNEFVNQKLRKDNVFKIINDSTLLIVYDNGSTGYSYLKKFSPKPDSTNVFIK